MFFDKLASSKVIRSTTPLEKLLGTKPDYTFLKAFGCACWPHLRPYNERKLQFRSKQWVLLGYSSIHKGYKCLYPPTGRVYISRDVVFYENIFPFSQTQVSSGSCPLYDQLLPSGYPGHISLPLDTSDDGGDHMVDEHASIDILVPYDSSNLPLKSTSSSVQESNDSSGTGGVQSGVPAPAQEDGSHDVEAEAEEFWAIFALFCRVLARMVVIIHFLQK